MTSEPAASQTWDTISQRLRESLNASTFANWFGAATPVEQDADRLVLAVPNEFTKTWIEGHFGSLLNAAAAEHDLVLELRVKTRGRYDVETRAFTPRQRQMMAAGRATVSGQGR